MGDERNSGPMSKFRQVFIVGQHRSATSEMFRLFSTVLKYPGEIEGHVWHTFAAFVDRVDSTVQDVGGYGSASYSSFLIGKIDALRMKDIVFDTILERYNREVGQSWWVDKTPGVKMVEATPVLARRFQNSFYIFMRRRVVENILSRRRRFGDIDFTSECREWATVLEAWLKVRKTLDPARYLEVDQQEMALCPGIVAAQLAERLGFEEMVEDEIVSFFRETRTEQTQQEAAYTITPDDAGWSEEEKEICYRECGPMMAAFGYEFGRRDLSRDGGAVVRPFCFLDGAKGVNVLTTSGETIFLPLGLMFVANGGGEEAISVEEFQFDGQSRFQASATVSCNLQGTIILDISQFDKAISAEIPIDGTVADKQIILPLGVGVFGKAMVRLRWRPSQAVPHSADCRIILMRPAFA